MGGIFRLRSGRIPPTFRRRSGIKWLIFRHSGIRGANVSSSSDRGSWSGFFFIVDKRRPAWTERGRILARTPPPAGLIFYLVQTCTKLYELVRNRGFRGSH